MNYQFVLEEIVSELHEHPGKGEVASYTTIVGRSCARLMPAINKCRELAKIDTTITQYPEGRLTCVIGDATGHGNKAGFLVATIKSLFKSFNHPLISLSFLTRLHIS